MIRVSSVAVRQRGVELYHAELEHFEKARTAPPRHDPDGIEPDLPPSGPSCDSEVPRRVHLVSEATGRDVLLQHRELFHNPPLQPGLFFQERPKGTRYVEVSGQGCPDVAR